MESHRTSRLLIVDDERDFGVGLVRRLASAGVTAVLATDVDQAVQLARSETFDGALVDVFLGSPSREAGLELIPHLKDLQPWLRVVVMTGFGSECLANRSGLAGAGYLSKPFELKELLERLQETNVPIATRARADWEHVQKVVRTMKGSRHRAAEALGIPRRTLQRILTKDPPR